MEPYGVLAQLVVDAPGRSVAQNAVEVLRQLGMAGDHTAVDSIVGLMARELGESAESPLLRVYFKGLQPRGMLDDLPAVCADALRIGSDLEPFKRLLRRHSVLEVEVLKAYVLAAFARMFGSDVLTDMLTTADQLRVVDQILTSTTIVPGDAADHSFNFGRDFLLAAADESSLGSTISHELGHHILEVNWSPHTQNPLTAGDEILRTVGRLLPELLTAALNTQDKTIQPGDPRLRQLPDGLGLICSLERQPLGDYLHLSLSQSDRSINLPVAVRIAYRIVRLVNAEPANTATALSPRGVFHFGISGTLPPPNIVKLRALMNVGDSQAAAQDWYDGLQAAGRSGTGEGDIRYLLGVAERPPNVYAQDVRLALSDADICDAIESGADLSRIDTGRLPELLRLAVRSARPDSVQRILAQGTGLAWDDAGLRDLGRSGYVVQHGDEEPDYQGPDLAALWATIRHLSGFLDSVVTDDGQTVLTDAAARNAELVSRLLAEGARIDHPNASGQTALIVAAAHANADAVRVLLAAGADVTSADADGLTALHHAASSASPVNALIQAGADVAAASSDGRTPLMVARSATVVAELVAAGADVDHPDDSGMTALMHASSRGEPESVGALLRAGADPTLSSDLGWTGLHFAVAAGRNVRAILTALLDAGAELDEETDDGETALMFAASLNDEDALAYLLDRGADVDLRDRHGATALLRASDGRRTAPRGDLAFEDRGDRCIRLLAEGGADVNATNDNGESAVLLASAGISSSAVELLLSLGADPNQRSRDGLTALKLAQEREHGHMTQLLLAAGASDDKDSA